MVDVWEHDVTSLNVLVAVGRLNTEEGLKDVDDLWVEREEAFSKAWET